MQPKRPYSRRRKVITLILGFVTLYIAICFFAALKFLSPTRQIPEVPSNVVAFDVPTANGPDPTWASPNYESAQVVYICAFGYRDSRARWKPLFSQMPIRSDFGLTYGVMAPAMPGQDGSPAAFVGFGPREAGVLIDTAKYLRERNPEVKIVLVGISLGGASAWLASEKEPALFNGIVSEAAFPTLNQGMKRYLGPWLFYGLQPMIWIASVLNKVNASSVLPINAARAWRGKPGYIFEDGKDEHFPARFAQEFALASGCPLWVIASAGHAQGLNTDPTGYVNHLLQVGHEAWLH